jgi:hypothetical protein
LPLSESSWNHLGNESLRLRTLHLNGLENSISIAAPANAKGWADESYDIVTSHVYEGLRTSKLVNRHVKPSEEYLKKSLEISE